MGIFRLLGLAALMIVAVQVLRDALRRTFHDQHWAAVVVQVVLLVAAVKLLLMLTEGAR